jgi:hypothetical protein
VSVKLQSQTRGLRGVGTVGDLTNASPEEQRAAMLARDRLRRQAILMAVPVGITAATGAAMLAFPKRRGTVGMVGVGTFTLLAFFITSLAAEPV